MAQMTYTPVYLDRPTDIGIAIVGLPLGWVSVLAYGGTGQALVGVTYSEFRETVMEALMDGLRRLEQVLDLLAEKPSAELPLVRRRFDGETSEISSDEKASGKAA